MKLRERAPKAGPVREEAADRTLERVTPLLRTVGITRVADLTGLDRVGIPTYAAIAPRSHDLLSVYNGKGRTHEDAKASAIMEAVERFAAWQPLTAAVLASYNELAESGRPVMDPAGHNLQPAPTYHADRPMSWVTAFDLLSGEDVYVPLCLAGYYVAFHEPQCFYITTGNGLASGNTLEEAICHGLCEVLERDSWTLADLVSNRLRQVVTSRLGAALPPGAEAWLEDRHPGVHLDSLPKSARWFAERIQDAEITLIVKDITGATGIPSFAAMVAEDVAETFAPGHAGYGTHPDAEVAVIRALTEAAQSRVTDIQGMREDITLPGEQVESWNQHAARGGQVDRSAWPWRETGRMVDFGELPSYPSDDVVTDLRLIVDRLREQGMRRVLVVDRTPPGFPVHVVRVIVPGLESFGLDQSRLGPRAGALWDGSLRELIKMRDGGGN
ncbi:YcaO-like family protein [Spongiactinospora sp. TRM90649]|uniref:YcaO-like family protein n=1 Tax=Spongiactinospora sp. TRM90649 TaxID=3031114 RepID=UPI0023F7845F|nr:YcaO-like family protein [Spongiactinospora sp. TRM90649]MDF5756343.1 YcaO-like family protein [Spongiactinospora sp. TRM90649]